MASIGQLVDVLACDKVDANGDPLNGYQVRTYASDGSTPANVWEERAKTTPKAEFTLNTKGYAEVYGDNTYVIKIWTATADPDVDSAYLSIGPVTYSFDQSGDLTGDLTGDVKATDGTKVLENGTNGTDSTYTGDVTGALTGNADTATTATKHGVLNVSVVNIGDWNMDAVPIVAVAHNLTDAKIRHVEVAIIDDDGTGFYSFYIQGGAVAGGVLWTAGEVILSRAGGGTFDDPGFDALSFNRGYITLYYVD